MGSWGDLSGKRGIEGEDKGDEIKGKKGAFGHFFISREALKGESAEGKLSKDKRHMEASRRLCFHRKCNP